MASKMDLRELETMTSGPTCQLKQQLDRVDPVDRVDAHPQETL
jgi:hypothetical protein